MAGQPVPYITGHWNRVIRPSPNPSGLCLCGCGQPTRLAPCTDISKGWVKGEPKLYVHHHIKTEGPTYLEEDRGYSTPCWIWQGTIKNGYGVSGKRIRAHRAFYEASRGPLPPGTEPDHLCQIKACVNPAHIEPVSHTINVRRGPHTRLTMEKAEEIRRLHASGGFTYAALARRFDVLSQTVSYIVRGKQWVA